ncbi:hypothetical protein TIFTF001_038541 [Ficus carica]|uniref:Uncharacterized protein n=1 Tax=Ficus carica TaxID=3494 RepID=A0AA88E7Y3_FICCA|nr:hypothetical protein TIFTF001_038526 [Ficus carica]GMN69482.1 hypothetical protein TIFTF001_038532 [Ficus carica]GMN69483.1 hypothetical protein TIFTF001_038535 [Ficus carica]GMN69491.1 hypothetical protein TIFTF001_038541 [Ficus carica]
MADPIERDIIEQSTGLLGSSIELLHTAFGSALTLLLTLVGFKYQGSATTLFREHSLVISLFIVDVLVYVVAFVNEATRTTNSSATSLAPTNKRATHDRHIFYPYYTTGDRKFFLFIPCLLAEFVWNKIKMLMLVMEYFVTICSTQHFLKNHGFSGFIMA